MKVLLFVILDHNPLTEQLLRKLSKEGYNGTVLPCAGMHHILPHFSDGGAAISLSELADDLPSGNFTLFIIIDEEKLETLKAEIRDATESFTKAKGGMFALPLATVEGSF